MDTQSAETAQNLACTNEWDVEEQENSGYRSEKMSFDPMTEAEDARVDQRKYCSVAEAGEILGKSGRQVQRLLKMGHLSGYKMMGPHGPQWMVDCVDLLSNPVSSGVESNFVEKIHLFESRFQSMASDLQELKHKVELLEIESRRSVDVGTEIQEKELVQNDVLEVAPKVVAICEENIEAIGHDSIKGVEVIAVPDPDAKQSWWHRAFCPK